MLIGEYIDSKRNNGVRAITRVEAGYFKVKWPLRSGWFEKIKDTELDDEMLSELYLRLKKVKKNKKKAAEKGMSVILARHTSQANDKQQGEENA